MMGFNTFRLIDMDLPLNLEEIRSLVAGCRLPVEKMTEVLNHLLIIEEKLEEACALDVATYNFIGSAFISLKKEVGFCWRL